MSRPPNAPDPALVEPRLVALREPFQRVKSFYYYDGGSIGLEIADADGKIEQFAIPSHLGSSIRYQRVFVGADYDSRPTAIEVENPEATKQALLVILSKYGKADPALDWATYCLTDGESASLKVLWNTWMGKYPRVAGSFKRRYSSSP